MGGRGGFHTQSHSQAQCQPCTFLGTHPARTPPKAAPFPLGQRLANKGGPRANTSLQSAL